MGHPRLDIWVSLCVLNNNDSVKSALADYRGEVIPPSKKQTIGMTNIHCSLILFAEQVRDSLPDVESQRES